ncbi:MAG: efflux RND transporter periplasmic adaptor subunit [Mycobacterium leprae]
MNQTRMPKSLLTTALLMAAVSLTAGCSLLPKEVEEAPPKLEAPVQAEKPTYKVVRGNINDQVKLLARLASAHEADLAFKNNGRLKAVYVRGGDSVKQGQVLAETFSDDADYQAAQAEIDYQKALLNLEDAKQKAEYSSTDAVQRDVQRRQLDLDAAQLAKEKWEGAVQASRLVAPFDGYITAVNIKAGDSVTAYNPVISMADPRDLTVTATVDDSQLPKLGVGQRVQLDFTEEPNAGMGTLVELPDPNAAPTVPPKPKQVKIKPDTITDKEKMGLVGNAIVILQEKKNVLLLDNAAIRKYTSRTYVLLQNPRREVDVQLGVEGATQTEIVKGLQEGDVVIGR